MTDEQSSAVELAADIVSAYVTKNAIAASDLPNLIRQVHSALTDVGVATSDAPAEKPTPAVPVRKSITPDFLICLEDGRKFKSLKRHLQSKYDLSPQAYREKWGLAKDYPIVAPNYAAARSELARKSGLGQGGRQPAKPARAAKRSRKLKS